MIKLLRVAAPVLLFFAAWPQAMAESFATPDVFKWGATSGEIEIALAGKCANGFVNRPIDPPFLPVVDNGQVQIDCDGFDYFGAPRWVEFVIGDDRLQMVWVMVEAEDRDAIVEAMKSAFGEPSHVTTDFIAFADNHVAWRHQPPEVLFYADELEGWVNSFFDAGE